MGRIGIGWWALVLLVGLMAAPAPGTAQTDLVVVELMFGRAIAEGGSVSDQDWDTYVEDVLSPNVPGFTVLDCRGGWRSDNRLLQEDCKYVIVLTDRAGISPLAAAVDAYKQRFNQGSVLWLERPCAEGGCRFR